MGYVEKPVVPGEVEDEIIKAVKMIGNCKISRKRRLELTLQDSRSVLCQRIALELTTDPLNDMRGAQHESAGHVSKGKTGISGVPDSEQQPYGKHEPVNRKPDAIAARKRNQIARILFGTEKQRVVW